MSKNNLEIACFNLDSAIIAIKHKVSRIELCENYLVGGVTPSEKLIKDVCAQSTNNVFVLIRPRAGDFIYSKPEIDTIKSQIDFCKQENCAGIVFGILNNQNKVDVAMCSYLVSYARPLTCTFHRAFDQIQNNRDAINTIIDCGFTRILTSGNKKLAIDGLSNIANCVELANTKITIVPAGGIRQNHIQDFLKINCNEIHSSAILDNSELPNSLEIQKMLNHLSIQN